MKVFSSRICKPILIALAIPSVFACKSLSRDPKAMIEDRKKAVVTIKSGDSVGSGFLVSPEGLIVTNSHVVSAAASIEVLLPSGEIRMANIIKAGVSLLDLAYLSIDGNGYPYIPWADSAKCAAGEEVYAIGAPLGLPSTVTRGIVSNCNRDMKGISLVQTDTAVSAGNSGGPLLNARGEALGVLAMKISEAGVEGIGFAIAARVAKEYYEDKLTNLETALKREVASRQEQQKKASWKFIKHDPKFGSAFWDEHSVGKNDHKRTVWVKIDNLGDQLREDKGKSVSHALMLLELDCLARVARFSEGRLVYRDDTSQAEKQSDNWSNIAPNTFIESIFNQVCGDGAH